jgi:hypothetical protein
MKRIKQIVPALALIALGATQAQAQTRDTYVRIQPKVLRLAEPLRAGKKKKLRVFVNSAYKTGMREGRPQFSSGPSMQMICDVVGDGSSTVRLDQFCEDFTHSVSGLRRYAAERGYNDFQAMISFAIVESRINLGNAIGLGKRVLAGGTIHLEDLADCEARGSCMVDSIDVYDAPGSSAKMLFSF